MNYYNENDPKAAAWLRELIAAGEIPSGDVDERSITEVRPHELTRYTQCHFFAGIGGWSLALRLAGWPEDRPVRTGSCPCQPFSIAGNGLCEADERHLWPHFRDLITFGEPTITFGEQVASPDGREWLARVRADLEGLGYEVGAADLCAAGVGAPHPRQRLYWMANPHDARSQRRGRAELRQRPGERALGSRRDPRGLVLANSAGRDEGRQAGATTRHGCSTESTGGVGGVGDSKGRGCGEQRNATLAGSGGHANSANPWSNYDICHFTGPDAGKIRRVEAGTFPLAARLPGDVGLLRGYGNAIVPQVAAEFILASLEAIA